MDFNINKLSLSQRIFGALFMVILFTAMFILIITIYHFRKQTQKYHEDLLSRKENAVLTSIEYKIDENPVLVTPDNVYDVLENKILGIAYINKLDINLYDIHGNLMVSTRPDEIKQKVLPTSILDSMKNHQDYLEIPVLEDNDRTYFTSYSYIMNMQNQPVAIINLPYHSNNSYFREEMNSLLQRFGGVILFVLVVGGFIAWVITNQITSKLKDVAYMMDNTEMMGSNKTIEYNDNDEIKIIVDSYNGMLTKLNEQSFILAQTEREDAWREMAKQVAHEVKNPLTPMRLLVQNYLRKFDVNDPTLGERTKSTAETLIHQIDLISDIAEAFSDFAKMPIRHDETLNILEEIKKAVDIFPAESVNISFRNEIHPYRMDRIYLTRIVTNLVKNAIQAVPYDREPKINIQLSENSSNLVIKVTDNGSGIDPSIGNKIFEPKFTTKNSGTGLGLAMVKKLVEDYGGEIRYLSDLGIRTTFTIKLPINTDEEAV